MQLAALLFGLISLGANPQSASTKSYRLPPGTPEPYQMAICTPQGPVLFWSKDSSKTASSILYAFDLSSGALRVLLQGTYGDILCSPQEHVFSVQLRQKDTTTLVVMNDDGRTLGKLPHPESGAFFFPTWSSDGRYLVLEGPWQEKLPKEPEFDPDAFTAIGVLDVEKWTVQWFPTLQNAYAHAVQTYHGKDYICVVMNQVEDPAKRRIHAYDLASRRTITADRSLVALCRGEGRRYYVSTQFELPWPFAIYESGIHRRVASFPALDPKTGNILAYGPWNPRNDNLIPVEQRDNQNGLLTVSIFRVSDSRVLRSIHTSVYTWSPDGTAIAYFRDGSLMFDLIGPPR